MEELVLIRDQVPDVQNDVTFDVVKYIDFKNYIHRMDIVGIKTNNANLLKNHI